MRVVRPGVRLEYSTVPAFPRADRPNLSHNSVAPRASQRSTTIGRERPLPIAPGIPDVASLDLTFLFTDIEASSRLWEAYPEAMPSALARHDILVGGAIRDHGGSVYTTVGDGYCATFAEATSALAAAAAAQRSLLAESWGPTGPLRIRIAISTGAATWRSGEYVGSPLDDIRRFLATMRGGDIVVAAEMVAAVDTALPDATTLIRIDDRLPLNDDPDAEVYELVVATDAGATSTPPARPRLYQLPPQRPAVMIGRDEELAAASTMLAMPRVRLVTLTGPGGVGKTRLAQSIAAESIRHFTDGACWVSLDGTDDPDQVLPAIAQSLALASPHNRAVSQTLKTFLATRSLLIVLDTFEHLRSAAAALADLLVSCPYIKVLVTSRIELDITFEHELPVRPLRIPASIVAVDLAHLAHHDSVTLLLQRAREIRPSLVFTDDDATSLATICRQLDGLPLAIELAAARLTSVTPQSLATELEHRLDRLQGGLDFAPRHRSIAAAFDWSVDLLSPAEQRLFCYLSVFPDSFSLSAAEFIHTASDANQPTPSGVGDAWPSQTSALELLASLVFASLVFPTPITSRAELPIDDRFTMLQLVRPYGLSLLSESGDENVARATHAQFLLSLAIPPPDQDRVAWLDRLDREEASLDAALTWLVDQPNLEPAMRLVVALWPWWGHRGEQATARAWRARVFNRGGLAGCVRNRLAALNGSPDAETSPIGTTRHPRRLQPPHR